jgi:hypothetical protein
MKDIKLLPSTNSWGDLKKKLEELTKSRQAKFAGSTFESVCKYFLQTAPQYQTKLKNVRLLKEVKEDLRRKLNLLEPINKGKLGTTQGWRKEERFKQYY